MGPGRKLTDMEFSHRLLSEGKAVATPSCFRAVLCRENACIGILGEEGLSLMSAGGRGQTFGVCIPGSQRLQTTHSPLSLGAPQERRAWYGGLKWCRAWGKGWRAWA